LFGPFIPPLFVGCLLLVVVIGVGVVVFGFMELTQFVRRTSIRRLYSNDLYDDDTCHCVRQSICLVSPPTLIDALDGQVVRWQFVST
jgi:hypothetical protein